MCGIAGIYYFDRDRAVEAGHLAAMTDRILHRGPDDSGALVEGNVALGMRRLSVIDVAGGHQPIFTPDGRYVIVFNGEVFNFQEERARLEGLGHLFSTHTDTEVVLHLYAEHGARFTDHLNGMFGLAIWDRVARTLMVVRDRIGIKPLYYYQDEHVLLFASEIKAILAYPGVRAQLDFEGLGAYLRYGFTPPPYTLFKGIRKLPPAHSLTVCGRNVSVAEYWRLSYADKFKDDETVLRERLYELLDDSVRRQMVADVPIGAFLSGGFDSSGIVHLMSKSMTGPVNTYSVGFGDGFAAFNELDAANRFAGDYHTRHHQIVVRPDVAGMLPQLVGLLDEPVADSSFVLTYLVAKLARQSATVILSGVGGDELFGGYRRYLNVELGRYMSVVPRALRTGVIEPLLGMLPADRNGRLSNLVRLSRSYLAAADMPVADQYGKYTQIFDSDAVKALAAGAANVPDYYANLVAECDSPELLDRLMYFDLKMSLPEQLLMLTDKMTMGVSLEARVPLLDHRVVEFAARLPVRMKVRGMQLRYLQRAAFAGRLPDYVFAQKKKGFGAPVGSWLRGDLASLVHDLLGEQQLRSQGLFAATPIAKLIADHGERRQDYTDQLWALAVFQLWFREYGLAT
jgi:asparagine synthase (glutamine-hydrolysing)